MSRSENTGEMQCTEYRLGSHGRVVNWNMIWQEFDSEYRLTISCGPGNQCFNHLELNMIPDVGLRTPGVIPAGLPVYGLLEYSPRPKCSLPWNPAGWWKPTTSSARSSMSGFLLLCRKRTGNQMSAHQGFSHKQVQNNFT